MTLDQRITTVLSTVSPLTAGQLIRALAPADCTVVYSTLYRMTKRGHVAHADQSAAQRHQTGGTGNAYTLAAR